MYRRGRDEKKGKRWEVTDLGLIPKKPSFFDGFPLNTFHLIFPTDQKRILPSVVALALVGKVFLTTVQGECHRWLDSGGGGGVPWNYHFLKVLSGYALCLALS